MEAIGAAARTRVLKQFTWTQAFTAQVNAYASLVRARRILATVRPVIELGSPTS
jgi:hypothetical protein